MPRTTIFNLLAAFVLLALIFTPSHVSAKPLKIIAFGDSLTAGYRLDTHEAFPAQLERALRARGHDVVVANAGVSGDTASGGLARLDWAVPKDADAVILELGANDALRGIDPIKTYKALTSIIAKLHKRGVHVLIAGMKAPRNMGKDYAQTFDRMYTYLAEHHGAILYPFFLDGVAGIHKLNQQDGLHPTAEGIAVIVDRIVPFVERLLKRIQPLQG